MYNFDQYMKQQAELANKIEKAQEHKRDTNAITEEVKDAASTKKDGHYTTREVHVHREMPDGTREHVQYTHTARATSLAGKSMSAPSKEDSHEVTILKSGITGGKGHKLDKELESHVHAASGAMKGYDDADQHLADHLNAVHKTPGDSHPNAWKVSRPNDGTSWFSKLSKEAQEEYYKKHPHAKRSHNTDVGHFDSNSIAHKVAKKVAHGIRHDADEDVRMHAEEGNGNRQIIKTAHAEYHPDGTATIHKKRFNKYNFGNDIDSRVEKVAGKRVGHVYTDDDPTNRNKKAIHYASGVRGVEGQEVTDNEKNENHTSMHIDHKPDHSKLNLD